MSDSDPEKTKPPGEDLEHQFKNSEVSFVVTPVTGGGRGPRAKRAEPSEPPPERQAKTILRGIQHFNRRPREIREYLDRFVISQDEAKKVLAIFDIDPNQSVIPT